MVDTVKKIRVLIIDRFPAFREGLCRILNDEGDMEVIADSGASQQVDILAGELKPDVVILDYDLCGPLAAGMTGRIKAASPDSAVIMMDGRASEQNMLDTLRAGAEAYLLRETPLTELISNIRMVHSGTEILDPKTASKILHRIAIRPAVTGRSVVKLRNRELEVLHLTAKGMHNGEIAKKLFISRRTVQTHLKKIFERLSVGSRTEAVMYALKEGWLNLDDFTGHDN